MAMMKKHFEEMAEAFRYQMNESDRRGGDAIEATKQTARELATRFVMMAVADNPQFDVSRFYRAAGMEN